jgi:hypothetical protein
MPCGVVATSLLRNTLCKSLETNAAGRRLIFGFGFGFGFGIGIGIDPSPRPIAIPIPIPEKAGERGSDKQIVSPDNTTPAAAGSQAKYHTYPPEFVRRVPRS